MMIAQKIFDELTTLFVEASVIVLTAFISPFKTDRDVVRNLVNTKDFIEIYCQCDLAVSLLQYETG